MQHATSLRDLSSSARETADKLEFLESAIRAEGCALALVRFREKHGESRSLVDLGGAATELRAFAAILESNAHLAEMRARKAAKKAPISPSPADSPES